MSSELCVETIEIAGQTFQVRCAPEKVKGLQQSAQHVDSKLQEIQEQRHTAHLDRAAILAALHIAHELLIEKQQWTACIEAMGSKIRELQQKIEKISVETLESS